MKVVATQTGYYNNQLRDVGEVFELLNFEDGSEPQGSRRVPMLDDKQQPIPGRFTRVPEYEYGPDGKPLTHNGKPMVRHRDFAQDLGTISIEEGPFAGESLRVGWMKRVPDTVPIGLYPEGTYFWDKTVQLPVPYVRPVGPDHPRASAIRRFLPQPA